VLWLAVEIVDYFFGAALAGDIKRYWWGFMLLGAVWGIVRAWPRLRAKENVARTDCDIEIRVCDMFSLRDVDYVIGAATTFDTSLEDGTVSKKSVQGQFTTTFVDSIDQLDREIAHSLAGAAHTTLTDLEKPYGKKLKYSIGTTAVVLAKQRRAYFVAMAHLNANRVCHSTLQDVLDALPRLWEAVRDRGGLEPLCCPILGSGYARLDATREELIHEIIRSFIPAIRAGMFCRSLVIAIHPMDYRAGRLDIRRLESFLAHECCYG
jgi:hypothetical protein